MDFYIGQKLTKMIKSILLHLRVPSYTLTFETYILMCIYTKRERSFCDLKNFQLMFITKNLLVALPNKYIKNLIHAQHW
jgi:hypothetical protein